MARLFYLRMLLMVVKGAKSYEDVRTYQNVVYPTFREACKAHGLIGDDSEWFALFDEAIIWATASQLRHLFMTVVAYCNISDVCLLFEKYWQYMTDDILHRIRRALQICHCRRTATCTAGSNKETKPPEIPKLRPDHSTSSQHFPPT